MGMELGVRFTVGWINHLCISNIWDKYKLLYTLFFIYIPTENIHLLR